MGLPLFFRKSSISLPLPILISNLSVRGFQVPEVRVATFCREVPEEVPTRPQGFRSFFERRDLFGGRRGPGGDLLRGLRETPSAQRKIEMGAGERPVEPT